VGEGIVRTCLQLQQGKLTSALDGPATLLATAFSLASDGGLWQSAMRNPNRGPFWEAGTTDLEATPKQAWSSTLLLLAAVLPLVGGAYVCAHNIRCFLPFCQPPPGNAHADHSGDGLVEAEDTLYGDGVGEEDKYDSYRTGNVGWGREPMGLEHETI